MTLHTRIPIEECKARLESAIDAERLAFTWSGYAGSKPILGKIRETSFRLQKRRYYQNSFAPFFFGRLASADGGSIIEGEFRMHPFVRVFMFVWFLFLAIFGVAMLIAYISDPGHFQGALGLAIPAGMAVFGAALVKFGRWLGRGEERAILAFLKSTLEADNAIPPLNSLN